MGEKIVVTNPATLEKVGEVPILTKDMAAQAVRQARIAHQSWGSLALEERIKYFKLLKKYIRKNYREFVEVLQKETAKPWAEAMIEAVYMVDAIDYWTKNAYRFLQEKIRPHFLLFYKKVKSLYQGKPVVAIIGPWNLPLTLNFGEAIPALIAGSCVVIKPSSYTPLSSLHMLEVCKKLGFPENVVQVVTGPGQEIGEELIRLCDMVAFTGSVKTGRAVAASAGQKMVRADLELGGKTPFIVLKDADLERAANCAVWNSFANAGHYCKSAERIYVEEEVFDKFLTKVVKKTAKLRPGIDYGPIIAPFQINIIKEQIDDALDKGAKIVCGGGALPQIFKGRWFEPTILINVNHSMEIMREETFGPVMPIMRVKDAKEALAMANDCELGLNAVIFSKDTKEAERLAEKIQAGTITINDAMINYLVIGAPQGGVKLSGLGRRHGREGMQRFCDQKTILTHSWPFYFLGKKEPWWFPYSKLTQLFFKFVMKVLR